MQSIKEVLEKGSFECSCGRVHKTLVKEVIIEEGAVNKVPQLLAKYGFNNPFLVYDKNTYKAAGERVEALLAESGIHHSGYMYKDEHISPDERAVGQLAIALNPASDCIVAVGSGTINDIVKMVSRTSGKPYVIVGTAPSMDGFASSTSSMAVDGIKVSLESATPVIIVADTEIMANAPMELLQAGFGDMLAKYISICEWRISHLINGEYYCELVADLIRTALERCVGTLEAVRNRDPQGAAAMVEGLILSGISISYAGISRPVSGVEHYFSHIWDMRGLEFGTPTQLHGIQCGIGTLLARKAYDYLVTATPSLEQAEKAIDEFDLDSWNKHLVEFLGAAGYPLIEQEKREGKYDKPRAKKRAAFITNNWQEIIAIVNEELPPTRELAEMLDHVGIDYNNLDSALIKQMFKTTKDIRDKYAISQLLWDIGLLDFCAEQVY